MYGHDVELYNRDLIFLTDIFSRETRIFQANSVLLLC